MSNPETPVSRRTFQAVYELVTYIPRLSDSDIIKGINHASKMTLPGCLAVIDEMYLKGWTMAV